jgi:hypothetical protein
MTEAVASRRARGGRRARRALSLALIVLASLTALAGGVALYLREEIVSSKAFADRAVDAMHKPGLQRVVAREITVQVLEPGIPDAVAARPAIVSAVQAVVASEPFGDVVRLSAAHGHRLLFERGGNAVFDLADAGTVVASGLQTFAPRVARDIQPKAEAVILTLRRRSFAHGTLRFADSVRVLGLVLPPVALALFALAIAVDPDRRSAITRSALALGVTGIAFVVAYVIFRHYVLTHVYGGEELTNGDVRAGVGDLLGAYLGDLLTWALLVTGVAWLVAAASSSVLAPYSARAVVRRLPELARRTSTPRLAAARGGLAVAVGLFVVLEPSLALRILAVLGGGLLIYAGTGEVLSATAPARSRTRGERERAVRRGLAAGLACATATAVLLAVTLTRGAPPVRASSVATCNGYAKLCPRRLDQVVFAGTHNSMSAADSPGWLIANQQHKIDRQLEDGIRLFKISTHYGTADSAGLVHTDIAAEGRMLNRVASKLDPRARAALQRVSRALRRGSLSGSRRDIWLCHTMCELGATRMVDFLTTMRRFLDRNPNQVMVLFDEDYVRQRDLQDAFMRAGLFDRLATLHPGQPLPTLGALIRSRHNIVVFAQDPPKGKAAWDADGFRWIQDTPLGAQKPRQFTCRENRGAATNPLLMMNNWADVFPPRLGPNVPLVQRRFILKRARQCLARRGKLPNFILTDFYNRGDVVGAVAKLNGVGGRRPAATVPLNPIP